MRGFTPLAVVLADVRVVVVDDALLPRGKGQLLAIASYMYSMCVGPESTSWAPSTNAQ